MLTSPQVGVRSIAGAKSAISDCNFLLARLHIVQKGQTSDALWRLSSSSVVVCNTPRRRIYNVTHQGTARDGGPVVLRPVRATPYLVAFVVFSFFSTTSRA